MHVIPERSLSRKEEGHKKLLLASCWIAIIDDASVLLFSPDVANLVLQPQPFATSAIYLYVARIGGALMLGWTALLVWAQLEPVECADLLLFTLIPVITVMAIAAVLVVQSSQISFVSMAPMFIFYVVAFVMFVTSYLWAKRR